MKKLRRWALLLLALSLNFTSGCVIGPSAVEELYSLPAVADEYIHLQELLDMEIASGCEYAAPIQGNFRQSVQQHDLDGDGAEEAVAFFRDPARVPRVCVYSVVGEERDYSLVATITGEGAETGRVEYADLNGDGCAELLVAWQLSTGMCILKAYSFAGAEVSVILTDDCADYRVTDLTGDGRPELFILSLDSESGAVMDMYDFGPRGAVMTSAALSVGLSGVDRIRRGTLSDGAKALFVEGALSGGGLVTDVLTLTDGQLQNVSLGRDGVSVTARESGAYASDIDEDGVAEVPDVETYKLPDGTEYRYFDWYVFDGGGGRSLKLSTYHCTDYGWMMRLEGGLRASEVKSERSRAGEIRTVFRGRGAGEELLAIYTLTGDNRYERARLSGRFTLEENGDTVYAAELLATSMTESDVRMSFGIIYAEWITGEL